MISSITISLPKQEKNKLTKIAGNLGISVSELSRRVLAELNSMLPIETIREYANPVSLKTSLRHAMKDWKEERVNVSL